MIDIEKPTQEGFVAHNKFEQIFESLDPQGRKTRIFGVLGLACKDSETMSTLLEHGMEGAVVRLSQNDFDLTKNLAETFRDEAQKMSSFAPIIFESRGPQIKTGDHKIPISLKQGQLLTISNDITIDCTNEIIYTLYEEFPQAVQIDSIVYFNRGEITAVVKEIGETDVVLSILNEGQLHEKSVINVPGCEIAQPVLGQKDLNDFDQFADLCSAVLVSYARKAEDMEIARQELGERYSGKLFLAKIENQVGLQNFEEILQACDGVVVDRAMLNLELPPEKAFIAQKWMIEKANLIGKPVLALNQILESMCGTPRPSRVEASNVLNLVQDGVDGFIMGDEISLGEYPVNALMYAAKIAVEAEQKHNAKAYLKEARLLATESLSVQEIAAVNAVHTANEQEIPIILVQSQTGGIARLVAKYKFGGEIYVVGEEGETLSMLAVSRGLQAIQGGNVADAAVLKDVLEQIKAKTLRDAGARVLVLQMEKEGQWEEQITVKVVILE